VKQALPYVTLKAGEFRQINNVLVSNGLNVGQGFVKVERVGTGAAPYYAYPVINDQATSDGSFILPSCYKSQVGVRRFTLPVAVEAGGFRTEVILTNATTIPRNVSLTFVADAIQSPDHSATWSLQLQPAEQRLIPELVQFLRSQGVAGVGPAGGVFAGKGRTREGIAVKARQWVQLNAVLKEAPGTSQGYARVVRTSGTNPFIAYAVINDGAASGQRSGDGAYIAMQGADWAVGTREGPAGADPRPDRLRGGPRVLRRHVRPAAGTGTRGRFGRLWPLV